MLLFNYAKTYENTLVELAIPAFSITLLLILYLEGGLMAISEIARFAKNEVVTIAQEQVMPAIEQMLKEDGSEYEFVLKDPETQRMLQEWGVQEQVPTSSSSSVSSSSAQKQ